MKQNYKLLRINSIIKSSFILLLVLLLFTSLKVSTNPARANNEYKLASSVTLNKANKVYEDELDYGFKIVDKLIGNGIVKLVVDENKLTGIATGLGKTDQCDVDFLTSFEGSLNDKNGSINISVNGTGDPKRILIPGTISFDGPLKGHFKDNKLNLIGKVHIKGNLARVAGFKKEEDIVIEIDTSKLIPAALKKIQNAEKFALL